jgi:hypothetical protein
MYFHLVVVAGAVTAAVVTTIPAVYGGSERHYRHGDYYRSSYGGHDGRHYDRHDGGGLLGLR